MSTPARPRAVILLVGALTFSLLATTAAGTAGAEVRKAEPKRAESQVARNVPPLTSSDPEGARAAKTRQQSVTVVAHRGASAYAPENTLAAVSKGIALDADMVEVDVQQTKDGKLVAMHDPTLERTTDVEDVFPRRAPFRVGDFTFSEISKLDAGSWKHAKFAGERVPTLREVLRTLEGSGVGLMLEAKEPARHSGMGERIVRELQRSRAWRNATEARTLTVVSFDWTFQRDFTRLAPQYPIGLIGTPADDDLDHLADWAQFVNPRHDELDEPLVQLIHDAGMSTYPWTVDEPAEMRRFIDYGVDGVITNKPDVLRELLPEQRPRANSRAQTERQQSLRSTVRQPEDSQPATGRGATAPAADDGERGRDRRGSPDRDGAGRHKLDPGAEDRGEDRGGGGQRPEPNAGDRRKDGCVPEPGNTTPPRRDHRRALPSPGSEQHRALPSQGRDHRRAAPSPGHDRHATAGSGVTAPTRRHHHQGVERGNPAGHGRQVDAPRGPRR